MYPVELRLDLFSLLILLGIFQAFFLSAFFLSKKNRKLRSNRVLGIFLISLSLIITEHWLNYTGYMARVVFLDNFSEPLNFAIAPICYLYFKSHLHYSFSKKDFYHFIPFVFYLFYCFFYYLQTNEFKFNSFLWVNHPDWESISYVQHFHDDPLSLRKYINWLTFSHFSIYLILSYRLLVHQIKKESNSFWKIQDSQLCWLRSMLLHFIAVLLLFVVTKSVLGRDLGDYLIASYITLTIYLTSIKLINDSSFFQQNKFLPKKKYSKSSLLEEQKERIEKQLRMVMCEQEYYTNNRVSLADLSKQIGEATHHVSQVINEQIGKSFFEWIAELRIEKAKSILAAYKTYDITIEELAERVGYNSKSSFNKAFKKLTSQTPSEYKNNL